MNEQEADAHWMQRCEDLAQQAAAAGNTPVGAIVVIDGAVAGEAAEQVPRGERPFAHAELLAIEAAIRTVGRQLLDGATMYSSTEPCILCGFAIRETRITRVVIGRPAGDIGSVRSRFPILVADGVEGWGRPPSVIWWYERG